MQKTTIKNPILPYKFSYTQLNDICKSLMARKNRRAQSSHNPSVLGSNPSRPVLQINESDFYRFAFLLQWKSNPLKEVRTPDHSTTYDRKSIINLLTYSGLKSASLINRSYVAASELIELNLIAIHLIIKSLSRNLEYLWRVLVAATVRPKRISDQTRFKSIDPVGKRGNRAVGCGRI